MNGQKINLTDFENNWSNYLKTVMNGKEVILTKTDQPVAVITPLKKNNFSSISDDNENTEGKDNKVYSQHSEMWIG